jgi:hypothetical protein
MRLPRRATWLGIILAGAFAIAATSSAHAATLDFTGTLSLRLATLPALVVPGAGTAQIGVGGSVHLLSLLLPGSTFGPITTSIPLTSQAEISSIRFTSVRNLTGSLGGLSGGPPGGGPMAVTGIQKLCIFANCAASISIPLSPTGGAGIGIGGTQTVTGAVDLTLQHAAWTIGQPTMTIHTANSTISVPTLPGGFAHGPASLTSSTAQPSGVLQLVTVSKVFTSLTGAFPEFPTSGVLTLHFVPEPGTFALLATGIAVLTVIGRRRGVG